MRQTSNSQRVTIFVLSTVSFMSLLSSSSATCVVLWRLKPHLDLTMFHASPNLLIERDLENERVGGARQMVGRPKKNSLASSLVQVQHWVQLSTSTSTLLLLLLLRIFEFEIRSASTSRLLLFLLLPSTNYKYKYIQIQTSKQYSYSKL